MGLQIPNLEGRRLRLEPLARSHSTGMFELWRDPAVCEHSGPALDSRGQPIRLPAASHRDSDRLLEYWLDRARDRTGLRWAVVLADRSEFAGAVGFNSLGACSEYAYHFVPRFWGDGLASEASHVALSWSFSSGSESIEVFIDAANIRSVRLAERLGFKTVESPTDQPARYVLNRADHVSFRSEQGGSVEREGRDEPDA